MRYAVLPRRSRLRSFAAPFALRREFGLAVALTLAAIAPALALAQPQLPTDFEDQLVMGNLYTPISLAFLPDRRVVVAEREGTLRLLVEGKFGAVDPFVVVDSVQFATPGEGLLGVSVDSEWPTRPFVYVCYNALGSTLRVSRFTAAGDLDNSTSVNLALDPESRYDVLRDIPHPTAVNGCGTLRFGGDGMLYLSLGDGGDECSARDTTALRGVVLRLDVSALPAGPGGPPDRAVLAPPGNPFAGHPSLDARLVWAMGFRHPFRFHLDPADGTGFVADVGELGYEEINQVASGNRDHGWPLYEGPEFIGNNCQVEVISPFALPIHDYSERSQSGQAAIIGGGVYRPTPCSTCNFPAAYHGNYFFADYYVGFLRRLVLDGSAWRVADPVPGQPNATDWGRGFEGVSDFVPGPDGGLWYCRNGISSADGEVHRIVPLPPPATVADAGVEGIHFAAPFPSPARASVRFSYTLPAPARIELDLLDVTGRLVRRLVSPTLQAAGPYSPVWDGRSEDGGEVAPGVYLARLRVNGAVLGRRFTVIH